MEVVIQLKEMSYNLSESVRGRIIRAVSRNGIKYIVTTSTSGFFWWKRHSYIITLYPDTQEKLLVANGLYSEFGPYFSRYEVKGKTNIHSANKAPYRFRMR